MFPYLFVLFSSTSLAYAGRRYGNFAVAWLSISLVVLMLVLLSALRASHVGSDTRGYIWHYSNIESFEDIWRTPEIGFNTLMVFGSSMSESPAMLLFLIAIIVVPLYVIGSKIMVKKYEISVFLFI